MNFGELYLALSQGAVDGQENPLPTIQSGQVQRGAEVPGADRAHHHAAPGHRERGVLEEALGRPTAASSKTAIEERRRLAGRGAREQEGQLVDTFKAAGMTVIEPDIDSFRKPVLAKVPAKFESKWGKGTFDKLQAL